MGGEHSLEISAPQLLWFGIDSALNIFPQTIAQSLTYLNDKAVYRTAPATPRLLITALLINVFFFFFFPFFQRW